MKRESQKSGLSLADSLVDGIHVVALSGYLDGHTASQFERHLDALLTSGATRVVVELSGLSYIASAGVGSFIGMQHRLRQSGGNLQLVNPSASVREIFSILGLDSLFVIHEALPAALAAAQA